MTRKVIMPLLGETMEEGIIYSWWKKPGDKVEKGEILLEIESDKAVLEAESFFSGYLRKIIYKEEEAVKFGEVIGLITDTPDEPLEEL